MISPRCGLLDESCGIMQLLPRLFYGNIYKGVNWKGDSLGDSIASIIILLISIVLRKV